jgi:hypothetical protein
MPRQLRIQYEGAIYHLMGRGDRREEIFRDDLDRKSKLSQRSEQNARAQGRFQRAMSWAKQKAATAAPTGLPSEPAQNPAAKAEELSRQDSRG